MESKERHEMNNLLCAIVGNADLIPLLADRDKRENKLKKIKNAAMELNEIIKKSDFPFSAYESHIDALEDTIDSLKGDLRKQTHPDTRRFLSMICLNVERKVEFLRKLKPEPERICFRCDSNMMVEIDKGKLKCLECKATWLLVADK